MLASWPVLTVMRRVFIIAVLGAVVSACAAAPELSVTTTAAGATTTTAGSTTTSGVSTTGAPAEGVHLANTGLGEVLVDPDGMTLYVFGADTGGESTCYESCAANWPSVPGELQAGTGLDGSLFEFGTVTRTDGKSQLTVNGRPVYYFAGDSAPGDTRGQLLNDIWFVVGPDGEPIDEEGPTGGATGTTEPDGYGY